jgi:hypothetical protein
MIVFGIGNLAVFVLLFAINYFESVRNTSAFVSNSPTFWPFVSNSNFAMNIVANALLPVACAVITCLLHHACRRRRLFEKHGGFWRRFTFGFGCGVASLLVATVPLSMQKAGKFRIRWCCVSPP